MVKNLWLKKFNANDEFIWRRNCGEYVTGDTVVKKDFTDRRLKQLYDARIIVNCDVWNEFVGVSPADESRVVVDSAPVSDAATDPRDELRAQLDDLGIEYDNRWGEKRLTEELEKATAPATLPSLPGL